MKIGAKDFIRAWVEHEHHLDTVLLGQIQQLRQSGTPCYLGTNQERHRALYMRHEMRLEAFLDGIFVSSDLGARKPEPAFYEHLQAALGLEPNKIFFWDDSVANVEAALAFGWQAKVFTPPAFDAWFGYLMRQ